ncbi:MAG: TolC family protein [Gammaproteobacteria bacterium]|nr:TolC family protein [Gammaproteobacteria bacterium]
MKIISTKDLLIINLLVGACVSHALAQDLPLPEPLTLEAALQTASNPDHFEIQLLDQKIQEVDILIDVENANNSFSVDLKGRVRRVGVSDLGDADEDGDSAVSLLVTKPLYNFGKTKTRIDALMIQQRVLRLEKQHTIEQRRQTIMEKYFDVLNADNEFISENEGLAIGFIRFDRARENMELGLTSEIEVRRLQSNYELIRQRRYHAENKQRLSRMVLAEAMGFPEHLSSTLQVPEINIEKPLSDDVDALMDIALKTGNAAQILKGRRRLAEFEIKQADVSDAPRLDFELEFSDYEREGSTRDDWRATVYFDVPLYSGEKSSNLALAQTGYQKNLAELLQYRSLLRLEVLQLWQSVQQNRLIAQGNEVVQSYRDLYLDRSRAEYELEFRSDLGDAMVEFSRARTEHLRALYAFELAYYQLQILVGSSLIGQASDSEAQ